MLPTWCKATKATLPLSGCPGDKRPPGVLTVLRLKAHGMLASLSSVCRAGDSLGGGGGCVSPHPANHHVLAVTTFSILPAPCCPELLRRSGLCRKDQVLLHRELKQAFCLIQASKYYPSLLFLLFMHSETRRVGRKQAGKDR